MRVKQTMMKKLLLMLAMAWLTHVGLFGQSTYEICGTVVEKGTGEPVVAATVQLMTLPDSVFVSGTTTGTQGGFALKGVSKGAYALKVSYIGYSTKSVAVDLTAQKKKNVNVGYITMSADAIQLKGVEVMPLPIVCPRELRSRLWLSSCQVPRLIRQVTLPSMVKR